MINRVTGTTCSPVHVFLHGCACDCVFFFFFFFQNATRFRYPIDSIARNSISPLDAAFCFASFRRAFRSARLFEEWRRKLSKKFFILLFSKSFAFSDGALAIFISGPSFPSLFLFFFFLRKSNDCKKLRFLTIGFAR